MELATSARNVSLSTASALAARQDDPVPAHHASPVVAFIIGFAIITLASILNAAGLNLTKLDHVSIQLASPRQDRAHPDIQVRTSVIPKSARRKVYLRPLWLLGMILYM